MEHSDQTSQPDVPVDTSTVIALMITQYRMSKIEEIVTKNVFRVLWFVLFVYALSFDLNVKEIKSSVGEVSTAFIFETVGLFFLGFLLLYIVSHQVTNFVERQTIIISEMLVSLDQNMKDYYVEELYRQNYRRSIIPFFGEILARREELIWFVAVTSVLYIRILSVVFLP